ncbi:MAG: hypothetical protein ACRDD8_14860, partial [Bacteroidales bacterium]
DASDLSFASNLDYLKLYWDVILESGFCDGKAAFYYLEKLDLVSKLDRETLLRYAFNYGNVPCADYLLSLFEVNNAEVYLNEFEYMDDENFAAIVTPHLSEDYILNLDIDTATARHRYKTSRHILYTRQMEIKANLRKK